MMEPYGLFPTEYRTFKKGDGLMNLFSISIIVYLHQFHKYILGKWSCSGFLFLSKGHCGMLGVDFDCGRCSWHLSCWTNMGEKSRTGWVLLADPWFSAIANLFNQKRLLSAQLLQNLLWRTTRSCSSIFVADLLRASFLIVHFSGVYLGLFI